MTQPSDMVCEFYTPDIKGDSGCLSVSADTRVQRGNVDRGLSYS
jgi:hypothetical protein